MIDLKIVISDVDYSETMEQLLPNLIKLYNESGKNNNPVIKAICNHPESASFIIKTALSVMSQESKEAFICKLANANQEKIISVINNVCNSHGIELTVSEIEVTPK